MFHSQFDFDEFVSSEVLNKHDRTRNNWAQTKNYEVAWLISNFSDFLFIKNLETKELLDGGRKMSNVSLLHINSWLSRCCTARGSSTGFCPVSPAKVEAHKSLLFTENFFCSVTLNFYFNFNNLSTPKQCHPINSVYKPMRSIWLWWDQIQSSLLHLHLHNKYSFQYNCSVHFITLPVEHLLSHSVKGLPMLGNPLLLFLVMSRE